MEKQGNLLKEEGAFWQFFQHHEQNMNIFTNCSYLCYNFPVAKYNCN